MSLSGAVNPPDGRARPAQFPQDVPGIIHLMEVCFADKLDADSRAAFREYRQLAAWGEPAWSLARVLGVVHAEEWFGGVVWELDGRLVGNASITPGAFQKNSWLLGNVAVLPDFRGKGIGRELVRAALDEIVSRSGHRVYLQVDVENESAARIYRDFGFEEISRRATWFRPQGAVSRPVAVDDLRRIEPRKPAEWEAEYRMLLDAIPEGLLWNVPLDPEYLRPSFLRAAGFWLAGESEADWLAWSENRMVGACRTHVRIGDQETWLFYRPDEGPETARELLRAALGHEGGKSAMQLETMAAVDSEMLEGMGFQRKRTLLWMSRLAAL